MIMFFISEKLSKIPSEAADLVSMNQEVYIGDFGLWAKRLRVDKAVGNSISLYLD